MLRKKIIAYCILICVVFFISSCKRTEKEYWDNGRLMSSIEMRNGEKHGIATYFYKNGSKQKEYTYENGILEGMAYQWNYQGVLISEVEFHNDELNGKAIYYNDEGKKEEILHYKAGKLDGNYTRFYSTGEVKVEGAYIEGLFHGDWKYYDYMGLLVGDANFDKGKGIQKAYYRNGKIKRLISFENNMKNGKEIWYDEDGNITKELFYKDDSSIHQ